MNERKFTKIICIDFDGVLHSYTSGWQGAHNVTDEPVFGAIDWLIALYESDDFDPQIYSSRSKQEGGIQAMKSWLVYHGLPQGIANDLQFPTQKPPAYLTIDDRAICFKGRFPQLQEIADFRPWNKKTSEI